MPIKTKNCKIFILSIILVYLSVFAVGSTDFQTVPPEKISLALPNPCEMVAGDSRVVEVLWYSGHDNLIFDNFTPVTERRLIWKITPPDIAKIDNYGRLETIRPGIIKITATSTADSNVSETRLINIIANSSQSDNYAKRVISYSLRPSNPVENLQKIVDMISGDEVKKDNNIPDEIKKASANAPNIKTDSINIGRVGWSLVNFSDNSGGRYLIRVDDSLSLNSRDKVQYFMGDRYLPDSGKDPVFIADDGNNGIWVVSRSGNVSHIRLVKMSGEKKASLMSNTTKNIISRMGLASGAAWNGSSWFPSITDNDGLWTSMYGAGEMMRYGVLKEKGSGYSHEEIATARADALRPLKAVLLLAYISGREGTVDARIRYLNNTRLGKGNRLSEEYLLFNKIEAIENYPGSPSDYIGFTGVDAGTNKSGQYIGGRFRFSLGPVSPDDWTIDGPMATTPRTLKGFIARTFSIPTIEPTPYGDGLFFGRNPNGTQTVLSQADRLYDYKPGEHPVIKVGNAEIPTILKDVLKVNNMTYNFTDVVYKGDTSTDEIIGHLFLYKIAYDTLDDNNPEEKVIRSLIRETVRNLATHMVENGYQLVDATGQGTKWGKTSRNYFTNDFAIEDNTLNSLVLLDVFKMAYYMTGEKRWQDEYLFLVDSPGYRYADLAGKYWEHWFWLASNEDSDPNEGIYRLDTNKSPSSEEYLRHIQYSLNYSDEEMAMLAYYLIFQMETDNVLLDKYRTGLEGWWHSISFSENPLWYYIYNLAYPNETKKDAYGHELTSTAAWALSRHPLDTRRTQAYIAGSRPDVLDDSEISINPHVVIGNRTSESDIKKAENKMNSIIFPKYDPQQIYQIIALPQDERAIHKFNGPTFTDIGEFDQNIMEPSTTYTLPYWFGRYHHMLSA